MSDLCRKLFFCCAPNRSKVDYDNVLADSEREAVADLLNYLENVNRAHRNTALLKAWPRRRRPFTLMIHLLILNVARREPRPTSSLANR